MNTLERLKELEQSATPGPWVNEDHVIYGPKHEKSKHRNGRVYITRIEQGVVRADPGLDGGADRFGFDSMADTRLIVALRNNAEALIDVVEAAKAFVSDDGQLEDYLYGELEAALAKLEVKA